MQPKSSVHSSESTRLHRHNMPPWPAVVNQRSVVDAVVVIVRRDRSLSQSEVPASPTDAAAAAD